MICPACGGRKTISNSLAPCGQLPCLLCDGQGVVTQDRALGFEAITGVMPVMAETPRQTTFDLNDWK